MSSFRTVLILNCFVVLLPAQQINIDRIELMPNFPQPYEMRDWKEVARGYDSLVFDLTASGDYLPLSWLNTNTVNYPENNSFGLHTVVGTPYPNNAEGINCIPALVGASLMGIDKSNQAGFNYVLGSQEWFNNRPSENVYLNGFVTSSGNDWWYDTMPNVFFYQLRDLYDDYGVATQQFESVARRWFRAVVTMGGNAYPWNFGNFNHRAWSLSTMTPNDNGVVEPEAAGAIGWLLYLAYTELGEDSLRMGAEWALEFLNARTSNPAYEVQMPYGAVIAARMNAELGTNYDVEKFLNWCFDITPLRNWGATLGNWGGYDCDGLIGEALYDGYAFSMNGFQQAGALAPLARYDDRFARALGKWILNLANASRLFYPNYLPPENQDSESWSFEYDPNSYIAHESLRETWMGISPYATGDAISGGWGATNLSLYSSSQVGYLAAVVDTTNIPGILQLDLLATDWYHAPAYPTFLYYNPYATPRLIDLPLPPGMHDIYELTSNQIVLSAVTDTAHLNIMGDSAWLVAVVPAGGSQTFEFEKLLIDGIIVDYDAGIVVNHPPRIKSFGTPTPVVEAASTVNFFCEAEDREDGQTLGFTWYMEGNQLAATGPSIQFTAPADTGIYELSIHVLDGDGLVTIAYDSLQVVQHFNHAPVIESLDAEPAFVGPNMTSVITCLASDEDSDELTYYWTAPSGGTLSGSGSAVNWLAPAAAGTYTIRCLVEDPYAASDSATVNLVVTDSTGGDFGYPALYLPFSGNVNDYSGYGNNGTLSGATYVADRAGNPNAALHFDGVADRVQIPNTSSLNFTNAISISLWINVEEFFGREAYPISHGNWENRWKISITNQRIRWTVKTTSGIRDLDSATELELNTDYHIVTIYDGINFDIYLNGALDQHTTFSGDILTTSFDLTIGQVLPGNTQYNFKGILDDIRLYDYALTAEDISALYQETVSVNSDTRIQPPETVYLAPNFPNPFNPTTTIRYGIPEQTTVKLFIYDITGRIIRNIVYDSQPVGWHQYQWNGTDDSGQPVSTGIYFARLEARSYSQAIKLLYLK